MPFFGSAILFELLIEAGKAITPIVAIASQYKKVMIWWDKHKSTKSDRLRLVLQEIDQLNSNPSMLMATLSEIKAAITWVMFGIALEIALLVIEPATDLWQAAVIALMIMIMVGCVLVLFIHYVKICKQQRNPVKYKAIVEIQILELELKQTKSDLHGASRFLTAADLVLQVAPYKVLKPKDSH
jgi:hypothetical protein